jgi:hypothetical protein
MKDRSIYAIEVVETRQVDLGLLPERLEGWTLRVSDFTHPYRACTQLSFTYVHETRGCFVLPCVCPSVSIAKKIPSYWFGPLVELRTGVEWLEVPYGGKRPPDLVTPDTKTVIQVATQRFEQELRELKSSSAHDVVWNVPDV